MTTLKRLMFGTFLLAAVGLSPAGCDVPLDATGELYSCEDDSDCISGYTCRPQTSGEYACALAAADTGSDAEPADVGGQDATDATADSGEVDADTRPTCGVGERRCAGKCVAIANSLEHCGDCGNSCLKQGVVGASCVDGNCEIDACTAGFVDRDNEASSGCECEQKNDGVELCNGEDDDCDGEIDEDGFVATKIAVGGYHTCAIDPQGAVYCWGSNDGGAIGDGTAQRRTTPTLVSTLPGPASDIAAGTHLSCAVLEDGSAWCWGINTRGQLGNASGNSSNEPVQVFDPSATFQTIDAGPSHVCAKAVVSSDVKILCWGRNTAGQLGDGTTDDSSVPVEVPYPHTTPWIDLSAGAAHSCGRISTGYTYCWGQNALGQLGISREGDTSPTPQLVSPGNDIHFDAISAGSGHSCGIRTDNRLYCWGDNSDGELGTGGGATNVPALVDDLGDVSLVTAGQDRTCAIAASGAPYCWGRNLYGELGSGVVAHSARPTAVDSTSTFAELEIYSSHACGITQQGHVRCWGLGAHGALGNGGTVNSPSPVITSCPQ